MQEITKSGKLENPAMELERLASGPMAGSARMRAFLKFMTDLNPYYMDFKASFGSGKTKLSLILTTNHEPVGLVDFVYRYEAEPGEFIGINTYPNKLVQRYEVELRMIISQDSILANSITELEEKKPNLNTSHG